MNPAEGVGVRKLVHLFHLGDGTLGFPGIAAGARSLVRATAGSTGRINNKAVFFGVSVFSTPSTDGVTATTCRGNMSVSLAVVTSDWLTDVKSYLDGVPSKDDVRR